MNRLNMLALCIALPWMLAIPEASAQTSRPVLDESTLLFRLYNPSSDDGYQVRLSGTAWNAGNAQDAIQVEVLRGRTTVVSLRCGFDYSSDWRTGEFSCESDREHLLNATGEMTVNLSYVDDRAETTTLIRTLRVNVRAYRYWTGNDDRGRPRLVNRYQIAGDDLLGTAFVSVDGENYLHFHSWLNDRADGTAQVLRCRIGDLRLDRDFRLGGRSSDPIEVQEWLSPDTETRTISYRRYQYNVYELIAGMRPADSVPTVVYLGDHPGTWTCDVRAAGSNRRTFVFDVDAAGAIAPHPEELSDGFPGLPGHVHMVDVRIPTTSPDVIVDPAAFRSTWQYGTPRVATAAWAEMVASLPPARGSSAPTGGGGGRRGRR